MVSVPPPNPVGNPLAPFAGRSDIEGRTGKVMPTDGSMKLCLPTAM